MISLKAVLPVGKDEALRVLELLGLKTTVNSTVVPQIFDLVSPLSQTVTLASLVEAHKPLLDDQTAPRTEHRSRELHHFPKFI